MTDRDAQSEWRRGWRVVLSAAIGMYVSTMYVYSLGPLVRPLESAFGWGREDIFLSLMIVGAIAAVINPVTGMIVDRIGAKRVALGGAFFYCASFALLSQAGPSLSSWWALWALVGIGYSAAGSTVWITGAASQFDRSRGMAISLCLMGTAAGVTTVPFLTTVLQEAYGWRMAYIILGLGGFIALAPSTIFWFNDERAKSDAATRGDKKSLAGLSIGEIIVKRKYWQLLIASALAVVGVTGLSVNLVPFLTDAGMGLREAAAIAGLAGIGKIAGRLVSGYLLDRIHGTLVGGVALALPIAVCVLLLHMGNSYITAGIAAILLGFSVGAETDVIAYLTSRYFGMRNFGFAFGTLVGAMSLGSGIGPWLGGVIFDRAGNYILFQMLLCGIFAITVVLIVTLGSYPANFKATPEALEPEER